MRIEEKLTWISDETGDSVEFSASSDYWWSGEEGMSGLNNDISTIQGIGQHGKYVTGALLAEREIVVSAQIRGDYETCRAELLQKINPLHPGRLIYENETITRYIRCYVKQAPIPERGIFPKVEIDFYCPSPFWKEGDGASVATANISRWLANLEFPLEVPEEGLELEYRAPSLVTNIINIGDAPAALIIEFCADLDVSNPMLTSILTQQFFSLDFDMLAGDCIRIKTGFGEKSAVLIRGGVETNIYNYISAGITWLQLAVGNNYLRASASADDNLTVKVMYELPYVGV